VRIWQELRGAWRSLRYDFQKEEYAPAPSGRRRLRAVATVAAAGVLVLGGAVGTYFAVVGGLGVLVSQPAPPADPLPAEEVSGSPSPQGKPAPGVTAVATQPVSDIASSATKAPANGVPVPKPAASCRCTPPPAPVPTPHSPRTPGQPNPTQSDPAASESPSPSPSVSEAPTPTESPT
jgi:hypothetical protein